MGPIDPVGIACHPFSEPAFAVEEETEGDDPGTSLNVCPGGKGKNESATVYGAEEDDIDRDGDSDRHNFSGILEYNRHGTTKDGSANN